MIVVFGSINLDLIGRVSRIPSPGETVPGDDFATAPGGKGANQALAARRAGASVRMVGAAGKDTMGDEALALLKEAGVDLGDVQRLDKPQGVAMIFVEQESGENVIGILPGANSDLSIEDAERTLAALTARDVLVVQQEVAPGSTIRALSMAKDRGARSILNTAPFLPTTREAAKRADIVVANETEFALLAGDGELEPLMRGWAKSQGRTIIVTLGAEGARAATPDGWISVPALKVTPIDTVGAGDTFVGYLAAGLEAGLGLEAAMTRAAGAASLACLKPGAQPAVPLAADVDRALGG